MLGLQLVEEVHQETLHGGVGLTVAKVRTRYWIPKLKQLVKKVRQSCHGCKRFQASAYAAPPPRNLPTTRTQGTNPYQVIGVDYADPIRYRVSRREPAESLVGRAVERLIGLVKSALTLAEVQGSNMEPVDERVTARSTPEAPCTARGWRRRAGCW